MSVWRSEKTPRVDISAMVVVVWPSTANQELYSTGKIQLFIPVVWVFFYVLPNHAMSSPTFVCRYF